MALRRIGAGLYVDDQGQAHLDTTEFLRAHGLAVTPENERAVIDGARAVFGRQYPGIEVEETKEPLPRPGS